MSSNEGKQKLEALTSMLSVQNSENEGISLPSKSDEGIDLGAMLKIGQLLSKATNSEDINTNLIKAINI